MPFSEVPFAHLTVPRDMACNFFAAFARVEYALKVANLRQNGRLAKASWDRLAHRIEPQFQAATTDPNAPLSQAVAYMLAEPPQVQRNADMQWIAFERRDGVTDLQHLFDLVKQVRNNLFHGGKYMARQRERDQSLIASSMTILEACVRMDAEVNGQYFN